MSNEALVWGLVAPYNTLASPHAVMGLLTPPSVLYYSYSTLVHALTINYYVYLTTSGGATCSHQLLSQHFVTHVVLHVVPPTLAHMYIICTCEPVWEVQHELIYIIYQLQCSCAVSISCKKDCPLSIII